MTLKRVTTLELAWGIFTHYVPVGAKPLAAGWVKGKPFLWIEFGHEEGAEPALQPRVFATVADGAVVPPGMVYIDSLYSFDGDRLLHVYGDPA